MTPRRLIPALGLAVAAAVAGAGAVFGAPSEKLVRVTVWTRVTADTGGLRQNVVQATGVDSPLQRVANSLLSQYFLKMVRKQDGAVKGFKGQTAGGSAVLFTRWMR